MDALWLLAQAVSSTPPLTPAPASEAASGPEWWRLLAFCLLMGGLFFLWWWVNRGKIDWRRLTHPTAPQLRIVEQRWIYARVGVALVEVQGKRFLLAYSAQGVSWQPLPDSLADLSVTPESSGSERPARSS